MKLLFRPLRAEWLALLMALLFVTLFNLPFWRHLLQIMAPLDGQDVRMLLLAFVFVTAFFTLLLLLLLWPRLAKPLLTLLLLLTAAVSYFMNQYGVLIDSDMVRNALQTDVAEAGDLLSWRLLLTVLLLGGLPSWWLWRTPLHFRAALPELGVRALALLLSGAVLLLVALGAYQDFASLFRNHRELRLELTPSNYLQATSSYLRKVNATPQPLLRIGGDARRDAAASGKPRLLVLVVGETARADHFSLNGYARPTNPQLAKVAGLLNFPDVWSCGTETAISVPCMFSSRPRDSFDAEEARHRENLLDVLAHAGVQVSWRDNNSGCKEVCKRVTSSMLYDSNDPRFCSGGECHDAILLDSLAARLQNLRGDSVLVLHQKGSHGPAYYKRYPAAFGRFGPVCETGELQKCSREQIVNAFDNTILYTDQVLAQLIATLQAAPQVASSMVYLSDHGESLGENNLYLHATPYLIAPDAQKHIPMLAWFSPRWQQDSGLDQACLQAASQQRYSHDNLFHSVLGLMAVRTALYQPALDIFAACRAPRAAAAPATQGA